MCVYVYVCVYVCVCICVCVYVYVCVWWMGEMHEGGTVGMAGGSLFNPELALVINAPIYSPIPLKNTDDTSNPSQSTGIPKSCKGMLNVLPVASKASSATMTLIFSSAKSSAGEFDS